MRRFAPGGLRSDLGDTLSNGLSLWLHNCIRATEAHDLRSTQTHERFTQRAAGKNVFKAERLECVQENNIEITS